MIKLSNINEVTRYFNIPKEALDFLLSLDVNSENGRTDFGENCYVNVQSVETKKELPLMEAHEVFVDVQCLIKGEETIYYTKKEGLPIKKEYNAGGDAALYEFGAESEAVDYKSGEAVILYPCEAHLPNRATNEPMEIKKAILKVAMALAK